MGVSIKYVGDRRRKAALRNAIWNIFERDVPEEIDIEAAYVAVTEICNAVSTVVEDMKNVSELNKIGYGKRHWYTLELQVSDSSISTQNTLEGANRCAPPPTNISSAPAKFKYYFMHSI